MAAITLTDLDDPRVALYRGVRDPALLREHGLFVGEGRLVVRRLVEDGRFPVRSLLLSAAARDDLADILDVRPALDAFVASLDALRGLTGFDLHRGCLALAERPAPEPAAALVARLGAARLVVVLEAVADADNVGGVFRNALAFGAGAVLLSPGCCDPLYRKAIRTSMAAALRVPFARVEPWPGGLDLLRRAGFALVALTPSAEARDLAAFARDPARPSRLALVAGAEGPGLSAAALAMADAQVRIPMAPGVDSLNLATAAGIALHHCSLTIAD
jgi:tRNA G18 (ribose-2'-O)-methylase SpoU